MNGINLWMKRLQRKFEQMFAMILKLILRLVDAVPNDFFNEFVCSTRSAHDTLMKF